MGKLKLNEGWGFPVNAAKPHFFPKDDSVSICGRWMFFGPRSADDGRVGPRDCVACQRKLTKMKKG